MGGLSGFLRGGGGTGVFRQNKEKSVHESARAIRFWGGGGGTVSTCFGSRFLGQFRRKSSPFRPFSVFYHIKSSKFVIKPSILVKK